MAAIFVRLRGPYLVDLFETHLKSALAEPWDRVLVAPDLNQRIILFQGVRNKAIYFKRSILSFQ